MRMKKNLHATMAGILMACLLVVNTGCSSLLPTAKGNIESPWETFEQAKDAFDRIVPHETTTTELAAFNIDPYKTPNVKILTYLDLIQRFMPNASITKEDLDASLRECISAKDDCRAYEIRVHKLKKKRYGNVFLDMFKFKRQTRLTGWNFYALVALKDNVVIYKIWGGQPQLDEDLYSKNPLGLLQSPEDAASGASIFTTF